MRNSSVVGVRFLIILDQQFVSSSEKNAGF